MFWSLQKGMQRFALCTKKAYFRNICLVFGWMAQNMVLWFLKEVFVRLDLIHHVLCQISLSSELKAKQISPNRRQKSENVIQVLEMQTYEILLFKINISKMSQPKLFNNSCKIKQTQGFFSLRHVIVCIITHFYSLWPGWQMSLMISVHL